jgi:hypothetical protein
VHPISAPVTHEPSSEFGARAPTTRGGAPTVIEFPAARVSAPVQLHMRGASPLELPLPNAIVEDVPQRPARHPAYDHDLPRPHFGEPYADETQTKREAIIGLMPAAPQDCEQTGRPPVDEASAESADRTVPPPPLHSDPPIDVDISFDDGADRTTERRAAASPLPPPDVGPQPRGRRQDLADLPKAGGAGRGVADEDEETETMELTPELRARVDQLMASHPAPVPVPIPPPRTKPPRR